MSKSPVHEGNDRPRTPARSAIKLWDVFIARGGLVPDTHDKTLLDELRARLRVPPDKSTPEYLCDAKVSTTDFLIALLGATGPWALMISAIYTMFERHGLVQSNDSVVLEFDFDRDNGQLQFSPSHFKRAAVVFGQLTRLVEVRKFAAAELHQLLNVVARLLGEANGFEIESEYGSVAIGLRNGTIVESDQKPESLEFQGWLEPDWPFSLAPPFPPHIDDLSDAIAPLKTAASLLCARTSVYAGWTEMIEAARADKSDSGIGDHIRGFVDDWKLSKVLYSQHDRLGPNLARLAWHVNELAPTEPGARDRLARSIRDAIDVSSDAAAQQVFDGVLEELLDLPLWKQRHQMYSIWLLTVIERALPDNATFRLLHDDRKLLFNFSTTAVAQVTTGNTTLEWVAELRTGARNFALVGEGRKEAVQPDYVLRYVEDARSALYVLEAKQYRKGDARNFSQALYDYAGVHREAQVVLVNYGSMPRTLAAMLAALIEDIEQQDSTDLHIGVRCRTFGNVRPDAGAAVEALRMDILEVLLSLAESARPRLLVDATGSMTKILPEHPDSRSELWKMLGHWNAPILLVADGLLDELPAREAGNLAEHIRRRAVQSSLAIQSVPSGLRDGAALLTDEAGFAESSSEHHYFSMLIVMTTPNQAKVIYGPEADHDLVLDLVETGCVTLMRR